MCTGEPAHSKCTWTCHKIRTILCGNLHGKCRTRRPRSSFCSSLRSRNGHGHVRRAILIILCRNKEMSDASPAAIVLCEPGQSTCTWTHHKSHFVPKFTGEMRGVSAATPVLCEPARSKCLWTCHKSHFVVKFTGDWPHTDATTSIQHRTVRTPQCGHAVRKIKHSFGSASPKTNGFKQGSCMLSKAKLCALLNSVPPRLKPMVLSKAGSCAT